MADRKERSWVVDLRSKLKEDENWKNPHVLKNLSIYRVPAWIKYHNRRAYKPQIVSFGPYHHGDPDLSPMEEHKHRALLHFLERVDRRFDDFLDGMEFFVPQLQGSYQNLGDEWSDRDRFLQLMIVDGCFLLEVIRVATGLSDGYSFNDPIFSSLGMFYTVSYIKRDMLMIENQLPLLVLKKLVAFERGESWNDDEINKMVLKFCAPSAPPPTANADVGLHPLDLFHWSLLQRPQSSPKAMFFAQRTRAFNQRLQAWSFIRRIRAFLQRLWGIRDSVPSQLFMMPVSSEIVRSAVELYEAGIRFKKSNSNSLGDIRLGADH